MFCKSRSLKVAVFLLIIFVFVVALFQIHRLTYTKFPEKVHLVKIKVSIEDHHHQHLPNNQKPKDSLSNHHHQQQKKTTETSESKLSNIENHYRLLSSNMGFDLDTLNASFTRCIDEELDIEAYCKAYGELYKFFNILGTVFGFIASDVKEKLDILDNFRVEANDQREHYLKTEAMMLYEMDVNKETKKPLLGSRTLLRLHRALKFTSLFMERLVELKDEEHVSGIAMKSYSESLENHHTWLVRNAAKLALYSLPTKKNFMKKIVPEEIDESTVVEKLRDSVIVMNSVYEAMEDLYTKHDLHGLP